MATQFAKSMRLSQNVWASTDEILNFSSRVKPGHMYENNFEEHLAAKKSSKSSPEQVAPFDEERNAAAAFAFPNRDVTINSVLHEIRNREERPTDEQNKILDHFVARLKLEMREARRQTINTASEDPLLNLIHGLPGTGKSRLIKWLRELMERGLGWTHGVQFVCLAFQNAMVAQINGFTIHHWSGIPARVEGQGTGDSHKQSITCQALRVIIIDEISMISAELLGTLEYVRFSC